MRSGLVLVLLCSLMVARIHSVEYASARSAAIAACDAIDPAAHDLFYLGGGYKYAMAGEGCAFLHAPPGFGPRPPVTGWFAEFEDLTLPPGSVGYSSDAMRFMGATFDPSALYRFNAVQRWLDALGITHDTTVILYGRDTDLSGAKTGKNGRHPLPDLATFAAKLNVLRALQYE